MKREKFRFDIIDHSLVLKADIVMLACQFLVSIISLGAWLTLFLVRMPRVAWLYFENRLLIKASNLQRRLLLLKVAWILRLVTVVLYSLLCIGYSFTLPAHFCDLLGYSEKRNAAALRACKWQVFGFRFVFSLLLYPLELVQLAVVYRNAKDMMFKTRLSIAQGDPKATELARSMKRDDISHLISPDVELDAKRRIRSFASASALMGSGVSATGGLS